MPLTFLAPLFIAFGLPPDAVAFASDPVGARRQVAAAIACLVAIVLVSAWSGRLRPSRDRDDEAADRRARRWATQLGRALGLLTLVAFAWMIRAGWPLVIREDWGLGRLLVIDEILVLLPYLLARAGILAGLDPAGRPARERWGWVALRLREELGMVLPVALLSFLAQDLADRNWPGGGEPWWVAPAGAAALGALVIIGTPFLVRLAWPMRSLPVGPLRDRLEKVARRHKFRYTDILVWQLGGLGNAGVIGLSPFYRYVMMSQALIENLEVRQLESIFGHEIGHVAHRHLGFFAVYCLGSLGVVAMAAESARWAIGEETAAAGTALAMAPGAVAAVVGLGCFFGLFGYVSRRFERQADVYGCRSISCALADCPPHLDANAPEAPDQPAGRLCPVGIATFVSGLNEVAALNRTDPGDWSWRHGSIAGRTAFLAALAENTAAEPRFQAEIRRLKLVVGLAIAAAAIAAWATGLLAIT